MKHDDLFAGIGGFRIGIEEAIYESYKGKSGLEVPEPCQVWANDIDRYACAIYRYHYGDIIQSDVRAIASSDVPDADLFTFGWPCQDNSIAGNRAGQTADTRSGLLIEAVRILRAKRPRYFVAENVTGLFSVNEGCDFYEAIKMFADSGYDCQWQVLDTRWFLPQSRERIYIVGHLRGTRRPEVFPIGETDSSFNESRSKFESGVFSKTIDSNYFKGADGKRTMIAHTIWEGGDSAGDPRHNWNMVLQGNKIRRFTPVECERLQGFPDIIKSVIVQVCSDPQKNYANAENLSLRLPRLVGNAERIKSLESASYVGVSSNLKNQLIARRVQSDVLIYSGENEIEIHNREKLLLSVSNAANRNLSHHPIKIEDIALTLVGINTIAERIIPFGKAELQLSGQYSILQKNGVLFVNLFGNEIMQRVRSVNNDSPIHKKPLKSITLGLLETKQKEQTLITLFLSVISAMSGYIPNEILNQDSFAFELISHFGWTKYGKFEDGTVKAMSDTQRYRCVGNAVSTPVVKEVIMRLLPCLIC
jgi:DNA (cytosine-5)-methyltransferase 1